jgi:hypothetical protein
MYTQHGQTVNDQTKRPSLLLYDKKRHCTALQNNLSSAEQWEQEGVFGQGTGYSLWPRAELPWAVHAREGTSSEETSHLSQMPTNTSPPTAITPSCQCPQRLRWDLEPSWTSIITPSGSMELPPKALKLRHRALSTLSAFALDFTKSRVQSYNTTFTTTVKDAYKAEGLRVFWRSVLPPLVSFTVVRTINFRTEEQEAACGKRFDCDCRTSSTWRLAASLPS